MESKNTKKGNNKIRKTLKGRSLRERAKQREREREKDIEGEGGRETVI